MIVVSDASPIINLVVVGRLELLRTMFGRIIIPETVFEEITVNGLDMPGADEVRSADWIEVKTCINTALVHAFKLQVDAGEAEAIALSIELSPDLLLIDERLGRQLAKKFDLPIIGLLGVLKLAKEQGKIDSMVEILNELINEAGFRISKPLYDMILDIDR